MTQAGDASAMNAGSQGSQQGGAQGGAQGAGVVDQAKDTVQQFAGQAKEQATQRAQGFFDQGKSRAAEQLTGVAQTLRQTTEQLQSGGQLAFAAPYLDRGVSQLERLAEYVRTADAQDFAHQAELFARRQPAAFLGMLFATGLAGARFLKSSQRAMQQQSASRYPNYSGYGAAYGGTSAGGYGSAGVSGSYGGGSSRGYGDVSGGSAVGGTTGSTSGTSGGSVGGFYDDGRTSGSSSTSGGMGSTGSTTASTTDASDERGMDIGPTSSGLRGDI